MPSEAVNIFWTGGWDSTYRVLDLVLVQEAVVQPHYILNVDRASSLHEIRAIMEIKERISMLDPDAAIRLLPAKITALEEIAPDKEVSEQYRQLRSRFELSPQYEWLNRYVIQNDISGMEIGFQKDDDSPHFESLRVHAIESKAANGTRSWGLPSGHGDSRLVLFERFTYPLLWATKAAMRDAASANGFLNLLEHSRFCHYPIGNSPCGCCNVCRHYMAAGLSDRFTRMGRLRNKIWMVFHPVRLMATRTDLFKQLFVEKWQWRFGTQS